MPSYGGYNFAEFDQANSDILEPIFQKGISIHDIYEVYDENKTGGLSFVCLCRNKNDKNFYVLKTYNNVGKEEDFKEEIEFALKLEKHPHIVYSQTAFKEKDRLYLVMELVGEEPNAGITIGKNQTINTNNIKRVKTNTGFVYSLYDMSKNEPWKTSTLETELQKGIKINDSFKYAIEFCRGMQYLNSIGMKSHGDIKPSNIFIAKKIKTWIDKENQEKSNNLTELLKASHLKEYKYVKIADFGFATLKKRTRKGWSDYYYSPEHLKDKILDIRSDIYSFGIVLYEMFNAGINLQIKTRTETKLKRKNNFIEVSKIKSKHCNEIIKKCLQPKQKERYQTFKELEEDLLKEAKKELGKDFTVEQLQKEEMDANNYFYKGVGYQNIYYLEKAIIKEAIKYYDEAIKIDPNYVYAYTNRGAIKSDLAQYKEAIKDYDKVIELKPNAYVYAARAYAYRMQGCSKEAIMDYSEAIKLDSNNIFLYYKRAELENYEEAIRDYDEIIRIVSKDAVTYKNRENVNKNWLKYKTVHIKSLYPQIIKNKDIKNFHDVWGELYNLVLVYKKRGTAKQKLKRYKEAIKDYDEVIKIDPKNGYVYCMRGDAKADLKQYEEAIKDYDEAIKIDPNYAYYIKRGFAKENLGKYEEAIKDYDEAIKINHRSAGDIKSIKLAKLLEYPKLILEELQYKKAIIINKKQISPYNDLIKIYKILGLEKEAKKIEEKLKEISKG